MDTERVFTALAEQLKLPLLQISQAVELASIQHARTGQPHVRSLLPGHAAATSASNDTAAEFDALHQSVAAVAGATMRLIDGYVLSVQLRSRQHVLLEPVSLSSLMYDIAHSLDAYAKVHDCRLEIEVGGRYGPVLAEKAALTAALAGLGHSFIEATSEMTATSPTREPVVFVVRRTPQGINTGVFSQHVSLGSTLLKQAQALCGTVRQPFGNFSSGGGAGVFIADALFQGLHTSLRSAKHKHLNGLAATLMPSQQLALV